MTYEGLHPPKGPREEAIFHAVLADTRTTGACPTYHRIRDLVSVNPNSIVGVLRSLERKGLVRQPYPRGPWVPLRDETGRSLELVFVVRRRVPMIQPLHGHRGEVEP